MTPGPSSHREDIDRKFQAAWDVFSRTCAETVAPEPTYQAWFAHYLISQFGIDRVAREIIFPVREFKSRSQGFKSEVKLDAVVTRRPGINLGHYAVREPTKGKGVPRGLATLGDLAVISELKVASSAKWGLNHGAIVKDFQKLSMLAREAEAHRLRVPLLYVCVLDNHPTRKFNFRLLTRRLEEKGYDSRVEVLSSSSHG